MISKTVFTYIVVFSLLVITGMNCRQKENYPDKKVIEYMNLDVSEYYRQKNLKQSGLQEIAPVILPEGEMEAEGEASGYHFGWPHAVMIENVILVTIRRGFGKPGGIIRSTDRGQTWEKPRFFDDAEIVVLGNTNSGKVVAAAVNRRKLNTLNVLISKDKGETWERHNADVANIPQHLHARIIEHPKYGLITGGHFTSCDSLKFLQSKDEGQTWRSVSFLINVPLNNHGTVVFKDGDDYLGAFVRNQKGFGPWNPYAAFTPTNQDSADRFEDLKWEGNYTNIWVCKTDGSDAIYNPVSRRIEAVTVKRDWGFPQRNRGYMTLDLWSISPAAFQMGSNNWRYEGTLLKSKGEKARVVNPRDGLHASGTVIDEQKGVQHIFVYSGNRAHGSNPSAPKTGRTGIFRITRTLDTEKWVEENGELENYREIYRVDENFNTLADWSKSGSPTGVMKFARTEPPYRIEVDLPEGTLKADELGQLYIKTGTPGYYGLYNERVIATNNFRLKFKAKIDQFPQSGYPLAVHINYGAEKFDLIIRKDGIYEKNKENLENFTKIINRKIDNGWHIWEAEVKSGHVAIFMDGVPIGKGSTRIDGTIGHRPISISTMTERENDIAVSRMEYFKFENIDFN